LVVIRHRLGMTSWYAHLSRIAVGRGTCVVAGARVGTVGSTGRSSGPHLHFELRLRGAAVDPLSGLG
ncbi:MAG: M23 family metallopeptidase, partial [Solirubrobacteraceae bacterium]